MMLLLIFSIKSALVLTLLYLPYTLMLQQERFFRMNRITLLTILILALVLPMIDIPSLATPEQHRKPKRPRCHWLQRHGHFHGVVLSRLYI